MTTSTDEIYNVNQGNLNDEIYISTQKDLKKFVSNAKMYVMDIKEDKIESRPIEETDTKFRAECKKSMENISFKPSYPYDQFMQSYQKMGRKKKVFCCENGLYEVKRNFTEGVQKVKQGEDHIYKVFKGQLDVYLVMCDAEEGSVKRIHPQYLEKVTIFENGTKVLPSNTNYYIEAPCAVIFKKVKMDTPAIENSSGLSPSYEIKAPFQTTNIAENTNESPSSEEANHTEDVSILPGPSGFSCNERDTSKSLVENKRALETGMVNDSVCKITGSNISDKKSKRIKYNDASTGPSTLQKDNVLQPPSSTQSSVSSVEDVELEILSVTKTPHASIGPSTLQKDNVLQPPSSTQTSVSSVEDMELEILSVTKTPHSSSERKGQCKPVNFPTPLSKKRTAVVTPSPSPPSPPSDGMEQTDDAEAGNESATGSYQQSPHNYQQSSTANVTKRTDNIEVSVSSIRSHSYQQPSTVNNTKRSDNIRERNDSSVDRHCRTVLAIRKNSHIESYTLKPGSNFQILHDNAVSGSFIIENDYMDPSVCEYHGEVQNIREINKFKNGSWSENILHVQKNLLDKLRNTTYKERIVVKCFAENNLKIIEEVYKKLLEMRNVGMIGSNTAAIIPLTNSKFYGNVSDAYEEYP